MYQGCAWSRLELFFVIRYGMRRHGIISLPGLFPLGNTVISGIRLPNFSGIRSPIICIAVPSLKCGRATHRCFLFGDTGVFFAFCAHFVSAVVPRRGYAGHHAVCAGSGVDGPVLPAGPMPRVDAVVVLGHVQVSPRPQGERMRSEKEINGVRKASYRLVELAVYVYCNVYVWHQLFVDGRSRSRPIPEDRCPILRRFLTWFSFFCTR